MPWVHLDDVVGALLFLLDGGSGRLQRDGAGAGDEQGALEGARTRRSAARPSRRFRPWRVRALYGEMAWIVTTGVRAVPKRLLEEGYSFRQPDLEDALRAAVG